MRNGHHRSHPARVTAGFPALGDEDVGTRLERELCRAQVAHLLHPSRPYLVGICDPIGRNAHVERDDSRRGLEDRVEDLLVEGAAGVVDGERPVCQLAQAHPLLA
jgi:hypothetical protein